MRLVLPLVLLAACAAEPVMCTDFAAVSVTVSVADADTGAAIPDATVTYTVDGDEDACTALGTGAYACGTEVEGDLDILVQRDGYEEHAEIVTVAAGECHVIGEALDIALTPLEAPGCYDDGMFPSLMLTVSGLGWSEYPLDTATATFTAEDGVEHDCEPAYDNVYTCGWEIPGEITWSATAPDHTVATGTVTVGLTDDGCHVVTEEVDVIVECLSC